MGSPYSTDREYQLSQFPVTINLGCTFISFGGYNSDVWAIAIYRRGLDPIISLASGMEFVFCCYPILLDLRYLLGNTYGHHRGPRAAITSTLPVESVRDLLSIP